MSLKMFSTKISNSFSFIFLVLLIFNSKGSFAQCAGADAELTICDVSNPANQAVDLFALLGPTAISGGVWTDPMQTGDLNLTTGVLNVWNIQQSGIYTFTYTVTSIPDCIDNSSSVVVTVGGYTGVTSPQGSACNNDPNVNLFQFFVGGSVPSPQFNGTWSDDDNSGGLSGNNLNATLPPLGTYSFTYSIPQIGTCPAQQSTAVVTIYPAPVPGTGENLLICEADDMSAYTNLNLFDRISGEDSNGVWLDQNSTNELSGPLDSFINVQSIYTNFGPGKYTFQYKVFPENPICSPETEEVIIIIEDFIDMSDATFVVDPICEDEIDSTNFTGLLTQGTDEIPDGLYTVEYEITGANSQNGFFSANFVNGQVELNLVHPILGSPFTVPGTYNIHLIGLVQVGSFLTCDHILDLTAVLNIYPLPSLTDATISIGIVCQNSDAEVVLGNTGLADGNYQITYDLFASNKAFGEVVVITVVNGVASFVIPASLIPNTGNTTLFITNIIDLQSNCSVDTSNFKTFQVVAPPFVTNITVQADNGCQNTGNLVTITDLGPLTNTMITYDLSGANTATNQTATFTAVLGNGTFSIPGALLPNVGITTITVIRVQDLITGCSSDANIPEEFLVNILPDVTNLTAVIDDVCKGETVSVALSGIGDIAEIKLTYNLSGANTISGQTVTLSPISGNATFTIPDTLLANSGTTQFTITSITNVATGCVSAAAINESFVINPLPAVANFTVLIPSVCQNQPVTVLFSSLGNVNSLTITYSFSGANTTSDLTQIIAVSSGNATFVIPSALLANTGTTTFTITNTVNTETGCSSNATIVRNFQINPLPDVTNFMAAIANACKNQSITVSLTGLGNLSAFSIVYSLTGANTALNQTIALTATSGNASFVIPTALIPNSGETFFSITNIKNTQTNCESIVTTVTDAFTIFDLPPAPLASDAFFCQDQSPLVSDLEPKGPQFKWYDSETATVALSDDFPLTAGNYYVSETNPVTGCESLRTMIAVAIRELEIPVLNPDGQNFCGADNPTLLDLANNITAEEEIAWYDAAENGVLLPNNQLLEDGFTYYGFQFSNETNCISNDGLEVTVSLTDCDEDDDDDAFFVPDGFSPNGDSVNDTFRIPDVEFLYPDYTLEIYNRYGNLLFKGNRNKPEWDGRNSDSQNPIDGIAPNGVYFYIINFNKNNVAPKQGRLYLNR